jgi:hypothetical protein
VLFVWCSIGIIKKKTDVCLELIHNLCMVNFAELCARGPKQTCRSRLWASQSQGLSSTKNSGPETPKPRSFVVGQVLGFCWPPPVPNSKLPTWRLLLSVRSPPSRAAFAHSRLMPSQLLSIASSPPPPRPHLLNSSTRSSVPPLPPRLFDCCSCCRPLSLPLQLTSVDCSLLPSGCGSSRVSKPSLIMPPSATPRRFAICWRNSVATPH